jgi:outer membrane lipoprotein-sorting protein
MRWFCLFVVLSAAAAPQPAVPAKGAPQKAAAPGETSLDAVMAHIDQAAVEFKSLTADIRKTAHNDLVDVDDIATGTITAKRFKPNDTRIRIELNSPIKELVTIGGGKIQHFKPAFNEAHDAEIGKSRSVVEQFMLLGFGSNSPQLRDAYSVTLGGPDSVNGEKATRIVLIPKDHEVLAQIKKCELWVSSKGWILQEKFYQTQGDYLLSTYSKIVLNPAVADSVFKLELPKGVKFLKLK